MRSGLSLHPWDEKKAWAREGRMQRNETLSAAVAGKPKSILPASVSDGRSDACAVRGRGGDQHLSFLPAAFLIC